MRSFFDLGVRASLVFVPILLLVIASGCGGTQRKEPWGPNRPSFVLPPGPTLFLQTHTLAYADADSLSNRSDAVVVVAGTKVAGRMTVKGQFRLVNFDDPDATGLKTGFVPSEHLGEAPPSGEKEDDLRGLVLLGAGECRRSKYAATQLGLDRAIACAVGQALRRTANPDFERWLDGQWLRYLRFYMATDSPTGPEMDQYVAFTVVNAFALGPEHFVVLGFLEDAWGRYPTANARGPSLDANATLSAGERQSAVVSNLQRLDYVCSLGEPIRHGPSTGSRNTVCKLATGGNWVMVQLIGELGDSIWAIEVTFDAASTVMGTATAHLVATHVVASDFAMMEWTNEVMRLARRGEQTTRVGSVRISLGLTTDALWKYTLSPSE